MGCGSAAGRVCDSFSLASSSFSVSHNPAFLLSPVHQGESLGVGDSGSVAEGCDRACFPVFGVLQPHVRGDQGARGPEADYRSVGSKSFCGKDSIQEGDHSVGNSFDPPVRLDHFSGSQGCVPSSSSASFEPQVSAVCGRGQDVAVSSLVLRPHHGASGVHQGNDSAFSLSPSFGHSCPTLSGQLVNSCSFSKVRDTVLDLCVDLGIIVNLEKSSLTPSQVVSYLGVRIDSQTFRASPTPSRIEKFFSIVEEFLSSRGQSAKFWRVLLGHLASLLHLVPGGHLQVHSLQLCLQTYWDFLDESQIIRWDASSLENLLW